MQYELQCLNKQPRNLRIYFSQCTLYYGAVIIQSLASLVDCVLQLTVVENTLPLLLNIFESPQKASKLLVKNFMKHFG